MNIIPVTDKRTRREFLDVARQIYRGDDTWVCPIDAEINSIFDPDVNAYFTHGEATRWILKDPDENLIGPLTKSEFADKRKELGVNEELDFTIIIEELE